MKRTNSTTILRVLFLCLFSLSNFLGVSGQEPSQVGVPIFSLKNLKSKVSDFRKNLNKIKRCLITGPCTCEEIKQVNAQLVFLTKVIVITFGAVGIWKGVPRLKAKIKKQRKELTDELVKDISKGIRDEIPGIVDVAMQKIKAKAPEVALAIREAIIQDVRDNVAVLSDYVLTEEYQEKVKPQIEKIAKYMALLTKDELVEVLEGAGIEFDIEETTRFGFPKKGSVTTRINRKERMRTFEKTKGNGKEKVGVESQQKLSSKNLFVTLFKTKKKIESGPN